MSVHGDTFNCSGGLNRADSSVVLIGQIAQGVFYLSEGNGFASADVCTTGSTRDCSGDSVSSVDNVASPQVQCNLKYR